MTKNRQQRGSAACQNGIRYVQRLQNYEERPRQNMDGVKLPKLASEITN